MTVAQFLIALVGPMVARVLSTLGITIVVLAGLTAAATTIKSMVITNLSGLPLAALQLGGLYGLWQGIGMVFGGITFVMSWKAAAGFWAMAAK